MTSYTHLRESRAGCSGGSEKRPCGPRAAKLSSVTPRILQRWGSSRVPWTALAKALDTTNDTLYRLAADLRVRVDWARNCQGRLVRAALLPRDAQRLAAAMTAARTLREARTVDRVRLDAALDRDRPATQSQPPKR